MAQQDQEKLIVEKKKAFLEFARIKSIELQQRQIQVSRTFTFFVLSTFILYGLVYAPIQNLNFDLSSIPIFGFFVAAQSRSPALFGMALVALYFFCKFGWVYHLSAKEILDTEKILFKSKEFAPDEVKALRHQLNGNFIAQSVVTFQFPVEKRLNEQGSAEIGQESGPLTERSWNYAICVNIVMILLLLIGALIITNFQIMIMLILGNITGFLNTLVGMIFLAYYGFFLFSALAPGAVEQYKLRGWKCDFRRMASAYIAIIMCTIFIILTTISVFITGSYNIEITKCRVTSENLVVYQVFFWPLNLPFEIPPKLLYA